MRIQAKKRTRPDFVREVDGQKSFVTNRRDRKIGLKGTLKETFFLLRVEKTSMSKTRKRNETKKRAHEINNVLIHIGRKI